MPTLKSGHSSGTETTIGPSKYFDDMSVEQKCVPNIPLSKVNIGEQIGEGAFGKVYKGNWR